MTTRLLFLPALLLLTACGGLAGKPGKSAGSTDLVASASGGASNAVASFYPAAGSFSAVPASVQINFSTASLESAAAAVSSYSISCGGNPLAAQSVNFTPGLASVTVSLPSITGLADGTVCTFSVNGGLRDSAGNFLGGDHSVSYTITASGTNPGGGTGGTWNEAAVSTNTVSVGSPGVGSPFMGMGASGVLLTGLLLNGTQSVNGISGIWTHGFASTSTSYGPVQGTSAGGFTQLSCPAGYRMTGVTGTANAYVNSIAVVCKTQDQTQSYTSNTFGVATGTAFTLSCPSGQFATDLDGTSDNYLESLYLGCR